MNPPSRNAGPTSHAAGQSDGGHHPILARKLILAQKLITGTKTDFGHTAAHAPAPGQLPDSWFGCKSRLIMVRTRGAGVPWDQSEGWNPTKVGVATQEDSPCHCNSGHIPSDLVRCWRPSREGPESAQNWQSGRQNTKTVAPIVGPWV